MGKYLIKVTEEYRADTEAEADEILRAAREDNMYEIKKSTKTKKEAKAKGEVVDEWFNVALMLQYGHGTRSGAWVEGIDYINPALRSIFDAMAEQIWQEVNGA